MKIPEHLQTTSAMVARAYPIGVPERDYLPLLFFMTEYFSEENIAILAALWASHEGGSKINDVLTAKVKRPDCSQVVEKLKSAGLTEWLLEE